MISKVLPKIDLTKLKPQELKNLLANNEKHGQTETVHAVLAEMARRGIATRQEYRSLAWHQDRVREILDPFKEIASKVPNNQRTAYTEAGGSRIGRSKVDPEWCWIDTYSAIKTPKINAIFVCFVKRPGDEPLFELHIDGVCTQSYNADQLSEALKEWHVVASRALAGGP